MKQNIIFGILILLSIFSIVAFVLVLTRKNNCCHTQPNPPNPPNPPKPNQPNPPNPPKPNPPKPNPPNPNPPKPNPPNPNPPTPTKLKFACKYGQCTPDASGSYDSLDTCKKDCYVAPKPNPPTKHVYLTTPQEIKNVIGSFSDITINAFLTNVINIKNIANITDDTKWPTLFSLDQYNDDGSPKKGTNASGVIFNGKSAHLKDFKMYKALDIMNNITIKSDCVVVDKNGYRVLGKNSCSLGCSDNWDWCGQGQTKNHKLPMLGLLPE